MRETTGEAWRCRFADLRIRWRARRDSNPPAFRSIEIYRHIRYQVICADDLVRYCSKVRIRRHHRALLSGQNPVSGCAGPLLYFAALPCRVSPGRWRIARGRCQIKREQWGHFRVLQPPGLSTGQPRQFGGHVARQRPAPHVMAGSRPLLPGWCQSEYVASILSRRVGLPGLMWVLNNSPLAGTR